MLWRKHWSHKLLWRLFLGRRTIEKQPKTEWKWIQLSTYTFHVHVHQTIIYYQHILPPKLHHQLLCLSKTRSDNLIHWHRLINTQLILLKGVVRDPHLLPIQIKGRKTIEFTEVDALVARSVDDVLVDRAKGVWSPTPAPGDDVLGGVGIRGVNGEDVLKNLELGIYKVGIKQCKLSTIEKRNPERRWETRANGLKRFALKSKTFHMYYIIVCKLRLFYE